MKTDVYQIITDRIIQLLQSGTVPWHKPWKGANEWPRNLISRKEYRGINTFLLHAAGYASPYWLSFKQIQSRGGRVRKGERSFPVVFWKLFKEEGNETAKPIPFLRYYNVWNVEQCDGLTFPVNASASSQGEFEPLAQCERVVSDMPKRPAINHSSSRAGYCPLRDEVTMPKSEAFESSESYYCTLFHELAHATGHSCRLSRKGVTDPIRFGSDPYSKEELVAEMAAAFLCGHCAIENKTIEQSAGYIDHWLASLKDDRKLVVQAAAQAQKACDFILGREWQTDEPTESQPQEFKVVALRECPTADAMQQCDTPRHAADYWHANVKGHPYFNPECECLVALVLNTRRRIKGHYLISIGTLDSILAHPRDIFRPAVVAAAAAIVLLHNHPSGDARPSDADIRVTRDLIRAGKLLKIELVDHIIMGNPNHCSLRELGFFGAE